MPAYALCSKGTRREDLRTFGSFSTRSTVGTRDQHLYLFGDHAVGHTGARPVDISMPTSEPGGVVTEGVMITELFTTLILRGDCFSFGERAESYGFADRSNVGIQWSIRSPGSSEFVATPRGGSWQTAREDISADLDLNYRSEASILLEFVGGVTVECTANANSWSMGMVHGPQTPPGNWRYADA